MEAIKQDSCSLKYASDEIRNELGDNNPVDYLEFAILKENKQKIKDRLINILNIKSNNKSVVRKIKI